MFTFEVFDASMRLHPARNSADHLWAAVLESRTRRSWG